MRSALRLLAPVLLMGFASRSLGQTIFVGPSVETAELRVELRPQGEDRFAIYLTDKTTGRQVDYEFDGEGANDPQPFLMVDASFQNHQSSHDGDVGLFFVTKWAAAGRSMKIP